MLTITDLQECLSSFGLEAGDTVVVKCDLSFLGPIMGVSSKTEYLNAVYQSIRRSIGDSGNLVVPTGTDRLCASGEPFYLETTSGEMGVFSEFVRKLPNSHRSLHPFGSYASEGPLADLITNDVSKSSFGPDTPKARLIELAAKVVNIGIPANRTNSVVHHVEQIMGVPYRYHKEFPNDVFARGEYVGTDYLLYVRRLECQIELDKNKKLFEFYDSRGYQIVQHRVSPSGVISCFDLQSMFYTCIDLLKSDIYGLLVNAPLNRPYRLTV